MEDLDGSRGDPHVDLGADERVRDRIQKVMDLDVIVEIDPRAPPFRELPIVGGQGDEGVALDRLEQLSPAQAEVVHGRIVHASHDERDAALHSASEKKVSRRNRPRIYVCANLTPASTFALSLGFPGRAGRMPTE